MLADNVTRDHGVIPRHPRQLSLIRSGRHERLEYKGKRMTAPTDLSLRNNQEFLLFSNADPDAMARAQGVVTNLTNLLGAMARPTSVIDIGAGTGSLLRTILDRGWHPRVVAVDVQGAMPPALQKRIPDYPVETWVGDTAHLPFETDEFDLAVLSHVLEHIPDPLPVLLEAGRVARYVYAEIPLEATLGFRAVAPIRRITGTVVPSGPGGHLHHFSEASFLELLLRSPYTLVDYRTYYPAALLDLIDSRRRQSNPVAGTLKGVTRQSAVALLSPDRVASLYNGFCGALLQSDTHPASDIA